MGPGVEPGSVCRTPVAGYDFLPTFHDLAGGKPSQLTPEVDGVSIRPLLSDKTMSKFERAQQALFFHRPRRSMSAIRQHDFKLMLYWNKDGTIDRHELYKVFPDPTETGNEVTQKYPALAESLRDRLLAHLFLVNAERRTAK